MGQGVGGCEEVLTTSFNCKTLLSLKSNNPLYDSMNFSPLKPIYTGFLSPKDTKYKKQTTRFVFYLNKLNGN